MGPERFKLPIKPNSVQIFEATLVMRIALNVIEQITRLWFRQKVEAFTWLCCAQLKIWLTGFTGMLQAGLAYQTSLRIFSHPTDRVIQRGKFLQRISARGLKFFDLTTADIGNIEQAIFVLPYACAMISPTAKPAISARHWAGRMGIGNECFKTFPRHASIGGIVG